MHDSRPPALAPAATLCAWCGAPLAPGRLPVRLAAAGLASHGLCRACGVGLLASLEVLAAAG